MYARGSARHKKKLEIFFKRILKLLLFIFGLIVFITAGLALFIYLFATPLKIQQQILFVPRTVNNRVDPIVLARFFPGDNKIQVFQFNENIKRELVAGYGSYKLSSVYPLLKIDKQKDMVLKTIFSHALGISVDKIIPLDFRAQIDNQASILATLSKSSYFLTNPASFFEIIRFIGSIDEQNITSEIVDSFEEWQHAQSLTKNFLGSDSCSVAVINSTQASGFGSSIAKLLEDSGVHVVRITNSQEKYSQTSLYSDEKCSFSEQKIKNLIPFSIKVYNEADKKNQYRAQVILVIGDDLVEKIY